jgi:ABC-type polysaccharide/polyol phosphate export permease
MPAPYLPRSRHAAALLPRFLRGEPPGIWTQSVQSPFLSKNLLAWRDIVDGFGKSWMWTTLALQDMKLRYRGSVLGPFWLTISTLITVAGMSLIYSHLLNVKTRTYLPYLTISLIIWQFVATTISESCDTFLKAEGTIKQVPIPFSIHAYRGVCRNLLVLAHNLLVVPFALIVFGISVDWHVLEIIPAILIIAVNGCWTSILLGTISARFRDVPPIVANMLQVAFLLTPIFWPLEALGKWAKLASLNPFFAAVDVVRAPLLGVPVNGNSWPVLLVVTGLGCGVTFLFFAQFRSRIAYWI